MIEMFLTSILIRQIFSFCTDLNVGKTKQGQEVVSKGIIKADFIPSYSLYTHKTFDIG
jgi:hypothetical protein